MLLIGPTGAGKSILARRIYELKRSRHQMQGDACSAYHARLKHSPMMLTGCANTWRASPSTGSRCQVDTAAANPRCRSSINASTSSSPICNRSTGFNERSAALSRSVVSATVIRLS